MSRPVHQRRPAAPTAGTLLEVDDLKTHFRTERGTVRAVDGVGSPSSGARPSASWASPARARRSCPARSWACSPRRNVVREGNVYYEGTDIIDYSPKEMAKVWGSEMAMVFQDPMTSLNPVMKIGNQITESLEHHLDMDKEARPPPSGSLNDVGIPEAEQRLEEYPHQLSGGMRQRVTIAIALACGPKILFADEPTTALDVTVQAQILDLLAEQQSERHMAMILVTHDLGVVAGRTDDIAVMYAGKIVEQAPTASLFANMKMPYTEALVEHPQAREPEPHPARDHQRPPARPGQPADRAAASRPAARTCRTSAARRSRRWPRPRRPATSTPAGTRSARPRATRRCARAAERAGHARRRPDGRQRARAPPARRRDAAAGREPRRRVPGRPHRAEGQRRLRRQHRRAAGRDARPGRRVRLRQVHHRPGAHAAAPPDGRERRLRGPGAHRRCRATPCASCARMQMIFQDPISSLNPRRKVGDIVQEPLEIWSVGTKADRGPRSRRCSRRSGIDPAVAADRRPHQFSGGQCQRICIARSLVLDPKMLICDEPVSALDVWVQAQILNLLEDLKAKHGLTLVFIAHDLAVVKNISDRVAVMYLGKLCEVAAADTLYREPAHPYTAALLNSIPVPDPNVRPDPDTRIKGELPSPLFPPSGCRFRTRCPAAQERCAAEEPQMRELGDGHYVACHFPIGHEEAPPLPPPPPNGDGVAQLG